MSIYMRFFIVSILLVILPLLTFIHELGHTVFALMFTDKPVVIMIGKQKPIFTFSLGRIKVDICQVFFVGGVTWHTETKNFAGRLLIILGGPMFTFVLCLISAFLLHVNSNRSFDFRCSIFMILCILLWQFVSSILPIKYHEEDFPGIKNGRIQKSDGLQLVELLKKRQDYIRF